MHVNMRVFSRALLVSPSRIWLAQGREKREGYVFSRKQESEEYSSYSALHYLFLQR
jgi:hypothetical protein